MLKLKRKDNALIQLLYKKSTWIILIIVGIIAKLVLFPVATGDYINFLEPWMNFIKANGGFSALEYKFYNYTPSYIYILILITKIGFNPLYSLKIISVLFEYLLAFFIGKIADIKYKNKIIILASLAIIPIIPSLLLNSSYLAQCDSIYASFAVGSIYFLLKKKSWLSVLFLGISFAFKMQAVMVLPFFFVMMLRGNVKWYSFLLIPVIYFISIIPAWLFGGSLSELLTVYLSQADNYRELTMNFPNFYIFIKNDYYDIMAPIGILITIIITLMGGILLKNKKYIFTFENWIRLAFLSTILVPFFLPGMHERYMYLGDALGVLYFLAIRKNIHFPIGIILVSTYSYIRCSRFSEVLPMAPAFALYLLIIILVVIDFIKALKQSQNAIEY
ncbi:hypothetical protein LJB95_03515 [Paludibacteraceae bacterium OttesenSCG-928-F17]|nr:hypothetical protein [Paludibacteraceae bacterium OttesenSCG-928-F17]